MPLDLGLGAAFNTAVNIPLAPWKVGSLQKVQELNGLTKAADTFSPLDRQAVAKISNTRINNVYQTLAKGSIPIQNQAVNTSGVSLFSELTVVASETVGTQVVLSPIICRVEFRVPYNSSLTNADVQQLLLATLATNYTSAGAPRFTDMMRGVLLP